MGSLDGKVTLVTGASSGLGRAAAIAMATEGARVVLAARRDVEGVSVEREIKEAGGDAVFVRVDVTNTADIQHMGPRSYRTVRPIGLCREQRRHPRSRWGADRQCRRG